jgi:hypothetical protein
VILARAANKRHHTVRTVFGILLFLAYVLIALTVIAGFVRDGMLIIIGFIALLQAILQLYKLKKGKGEEDIRSDEIIL